MQTKKIQIWKNYNQREEQNKQINDNRSLENSDQTTFLGLNNFKGILSHMSMRSIRNSWFILFIHFRKLVESSI